MASAAGSKQPPLSGCKTSVPAGSLAPLGDSQNPDWESGLRRPCRPICEGGRVMQCGNCENRSVSRSMSRHSTVGVLQREVPYLSIQWDNGCRAITKNKVLERGLFPRIGLLSAEASLGARETERPSRKGVAGDLSKRSKVIVRRKGEVYSLPSETQNVGSSITCCSVVGDCGEQGGTP